MDVDELPEFDKGNAPLRERTWADHDEPWQYQVYHLSERTRLELLARCRQMIESERRVE